MISCLVHTYNEEKNINRCLSSLWFADEIVVIDMGSQDKTREIAADFKAKIFNHPYTGFVEPARNFGIKKAKGDWILIIDADESVPRSLAEEIKRLIKGPGEYDYFRIPRKNIIFSKWIKYSGWWPDYQVRLFKKGAVSWIEKIHGIPLTSGLGSEVRPQEEFSIIHHHYDSLSQYLDRMNRYTSVQAKELYLNNGKTSLKEIILQPLNEFVRRYFMMEGYRDGIHGLSLSLLQSFSELVVVLKLWELSGFKQEKISLDEFQKLNSSTERIKKFWIYNELLKTPGNKLSFFYLKLLRKLNS